MQPYKTLVMNNAVVTTRTELINAFNKMFDVFAIREDVLYYQPSNGGWNIYQVLEHVALANHFLLRIVNKQAERAMQLTNLVNKRNNEPYVLDRNKLQKMELTGSYIWVPQRYTEPAGDMPLLQIKMALHDQLSESIALLNDSKVLEAIERTFVTGKIDALHYLYFLVQHMQRHLGQVERLKEEFSQLQRQNVYSDRARLVKTICLN
jgi:uncharacterized damage-inducible protein DinB